MKHKRTKRLTPAARSAAWLCSAFAVLLAVVGPLFVLVPVTQASPAPPVGSKGPVVTAQYIDSNHIAVIVSGTPTTGQVTLNSGTATVDFSYLEGIYVAQDNISPYPTGAGGGISGDSTLPTLAGASAGDATVPNGEIYQLNGSAGGGSCGTSTVQLTGNPQSGTVSATVSGSVPTVASGSSSTPAGQCLTVELSNNSTADMGELEIANPTATGGGTLIPFRYGVNLGNLAWNPEPGTPLHPLASNVMFYQASPTEIDATANDPSMGTDKGDTAFTFGNPVTATDPAELVSGQGTIYSNMGGYYQPSCVDKIFVPASAKPDANQMVSAKYEQCDPNNKDNNYWAGTGDSPKIINILLLSATPEDVFSSLVTSLGGVTPKTTPGDTSGATQDPTLQCTASDSLINTLINYVICPLIGLAWNAAQWMDNWINSQMQVDVAGTFDTSACKDPSNCAATAYYTAWNSFRILATAILIIAGLIMVVSQALGFEMFDAYTVRKVLPRLLIATIGISLSWPLMRLVVGFFDTLGLSVQGIMYAPFKNIAGGITPTTTIFGGIAIGAGILALGFASLTFVITAVLALFVGFVILIVRQIAITMLIILAPLAIACYILPNTQKVWKLWYDNFLGLMLMYPIVEMLIAAGHIFSALTNAGGN